MYIIIGLIIYYLIGMRIMYSLSGWKDGFRPSLRCFFGWSLLWPIPVLVQIETEIDIRMKKK